MRRTGLLCLLLTASLAAPADAGWTSLGAMPAPQRERNTLTYRNDQGTVVLTVLAPDIVRVRFAPGPTPGRDHSYAVVKTDFGDPGASVEAGAGETVVRTRDLRVTVRHDPFRVAFATAAGESLDEDDPVRGTALAGDGATRVWKRLRDDEHVYGFGEKTGRLDKRGWKLGGYAYAMWNSDTYGYDGSTDPVYAAVPFYMVLRNGRSHGIFLDNTFRSVFDVGRESQRMLSFGAEGGELDYYFIYGPAPKRVLERYTELTGRMPLPPRWALGYHQCRYSYYPEARVRHLAESFRLRGIPADAIWLDIHYQDGYKPFTWDRERFPDPARLIGDLRRHGLRVVTIVDAHPKKERGYEPYDSGLAGGHLVKNPDGSVYEAPVWPSQAERDPGPSVFPDFSRPAARDWWGGLYRSLLDAGVAGIWNDMNEPAVFETPSGTMPLDVRHDNEGEPTDHREIHNVYGLLMTRSTHEGLLKLRPDERPFVLTRATFAGGQRYAAVWPGDNVSTWTALQATVPMLTGLGLSGFAFVGSDIGGFAEVPSAELFTRWIQLGTFYPFMRTHTTFGTPDQEPWSYGSRHEELNRRAIELRYELLPHVYNVMREASDTGVPALRPLFLEHPEDPRTWSLDDQAFFGRDLLIAPVLTEGATQRDVYLPAGDWYDFWTGRRHAGGQTVRVPVTLASVPVFVRGGAFVFRQPVVQHTGEMPGRPLEVAVYPAPRSEARLYEDDGESLAYRRGEFVVRRFEQQRTATSCTVRVGAADGPYRPAARDLVVSIRWDGVPRTVSVGGRPLARTEPAASGHGWSLGDDGFVRVRLADRWDAFAVTVE
jgi:alpha-glucosidase